MDDANRSAADLSREERRFLLQIGDAGLVAFHPHEDEIITRLLAWGLVNGERVDAELALLRLTPDGHDIASRLRHNLG